MPRGDAEKMDSSRDRTLMRMGLLLALAILLLALACAATARPLEDGIAMVTDERVIAHTEFGGILGGDLRVPRFQDFAIRFGKVYRSERELSERFAHFIDSIDLIEETNMKNLPYTLGLNQFADLSWEEFKGQYLFSSQNCSATHRNSVKVSDVKLPLQKDWRDDKIVSPVKDQRRCGSCWTFSTTGALEAAHAQATGKMVLLSEQQLVDCAQGYNNFGCNGGLPSQAFEYIKYTGGLDTEDAYPYKGEDGKCIFNLNGIGARVYDVVNITEGAEDELVQAVAFNRPVSIAYEVASDFRLYSGGVYTSKICRTGPETVNHAVLAVGFNMDPKMPIPYWIIKNSWGESWGLKGYFHMELGKNMCGISTCASYPVVPEDMY